MHFFSPHSFSNKPSDIKVSKIMITYHYNFLISPFKEITLFMEARQDDGVDCEFRLFFAHIHFYWQQSSPPGRSSLEPTWNRIAKHNFSCSAIIQNILVMCHVLNMFSQWKEGDLPTFFTCPFKCLIIIFIISCA